MFVASIKKRLKLKKNIARGKWVLFHSLVAANESGIRKVSLLELLFFCYGLFQLWFVMEKRFWIPCFSDSFIKSVPSQRYNGLLHGRDQGQIFDKDFTLWRLLQPTNVFYVDAQSYELASFSKFLVWNAVCPKEVLLKDKTYIVFINLGFQRDFF